MTEKTTKKNIQQYLLAGFPFLWVRTLEPDRAIADLKAEIAALETIESKKRCVATWDCISGITEGDKSNGQGDPLGCWTYLKSMPDDSVMFMVNYHRFINGIEIVETIRKSLDGENAINVKGKCAIIVSPTVVLPLEIERLFTVVEFDLPDREKIVETIKFVCESAEQKLPENGKLATIVEAAIGLTAHEAENAFSLSLSSKGCLDPAVICGQKAQLVKKNASLDFSTFKEKFDSLGGMNNLKSFSLRTIMSPHSRGIILLGPPGTGKSHFSKALGNEVGLPTLLWDFGRMFGSFIGQSEERVHQSLGTVDAMAPCIRGNTVINAGDKDFTVQEIFESIANGKDNNGLRFVDSLSSDNFNIEKSRIIAVIKKPAQDLFRVNLYHTSIDVTKDHQFPVLRNGNVDWVPACRLRPGDRVASIRKTISKNDDSVDRFISPNTRFHFFGAYKHCPSKSQAYLKYREKKKRIPSGAEHRYLKCIPLHYDFLTEGGGGYRNSKACKIPRVVNENLAYVCGFLDADGTISRRSCRFFNTNITVLKKIQKIILQEFGYKTEVGKHRNNSRIPILKGKPVISRKPYYFVPISNMIIASFLNKILSDIVNLSEPNRLAYLSGYADGDGSVGKSRVTLSAHKKLTNAKIRKILQSLGVVIGRSPLSWANMVLAGKNALWAKEKIKPKIKEKAEKLNKIEPSIWQTEREDQIPIGNLLKEERTIKGVASNKLGISSGSANAFERGTRAVPLNTAKLLARRLGSLKLQSLADSNVFWSRVVSVVPLGIKEEVYDVSCEPSHNFLANGIFVHNCILFIDEMEKGLSGMASSGSSDGGVGIRVFSQFLTWLQDHTSKVYVVGTVNNVQKIDPEFLRSERWDATFFIDLPTEKERMDILKIWMDFFNLPTQEVPPMISWTGAEIRSLCRIASMLKSSLVEAAGYIVPQAISAEGKINALREFAKDKTLPASIPDEDNEPRRRKIRVSEPATPPLTAEEVNALYEKNKAQEGGKQ